LTVTSCVPSFWMRISVFHWSAALPGSESMRMSGNTSRLPFCVTLVTLGAAEAVAASVTTIPRTLHVLMRSPRVCRVTDSQVAAGGARRGTGRSRVEQSFRFDREGSGGALLHVTHPHLMPDTGIRATAPRHRGFSEATGRAASFRSAAREKGT